MKIMIHRGSREIGGTCIELSSADTRIVLDLGVPLVKADGSAFELKAYASLDAPALIECGVLPRVQGLYAHETRAVDAVIISHAHLDHYGFLNHLHPDIPVYMSDATEKLIALTSLFSGGIPLPPKRKLFVWKESISIGTFTLIPHLVEHSCPGAFAFEVEAGGKRLFYTGDFRGGGHISDKALAALYARCRPGVDALLMEGTQLGREEEEELSEQELVQEATRLCQDCKGAILVYQASQNIGRLVSFFKAAHRSGRLFVADLYTAHVLAEMSRCRGGENLPRPDPARFQNLRVWFPSRLEQRLRRQGKRALIEAYNAYGMSLEEIKEKLDEVILFVRPGMETDLERLEPLAGKTLIYSLWPGYQEEERTRSFLDWLETRGVSIVTLHASGHADLSTLQTMTQKLQPKQILPIHTLAPEAYKEHFDFPVRLGEEEVVL